MGENLLGRVRETRPGGARAAVGSLSRGARSCVEAPPGCCGGTAIVSLTRYQTRHGA